MSEQLPFSGLWAKAYSLSCNGGRSLVTCGRFDRLEISTPNLWHQKEILPSDRCLHILKSMTNHDITMIKHAIRFLNIFFSNS